jgi:hypothetical protein
MDFEVVGQIVKIETIALGMAFENCKTLSAYSATPIGGNSRVKPRSNFPVVMFVWLRYIGTKPTGSGEEN